MLLIIDNKDGICKYFDCEWSFLDTSNYSLYEILEKIREYDIVSKIYLSLELKLKGKKRQHFEGLELLKHIRLTPELGETIQFAPILLGYTYPLEQILRNPESTILAAPATYLFHLKNIHQINGSPFFLSEENLTKGKLSPYVLYTDVDEVKSEHDRRNEQGPLKLERELNGESNNDIGLELWQKKHLFLQEGEKNIKISKTVSITEFKDTIKGKRILYLDDEADKWEMQLSKLFEGATIEIKSDLKEIIELIEKYNDEVLEILEDFKVKDKERCEYYSTLEDVNSSLHHAKSNKRPPTEVINEIESNINYVNKAIKNYQNGLTIYQKNPENFKVDVFLKNENHLTRYMRYIKTGFSTLNLKHSKLEDNLGKDHKRQEQRFSEDFAFNRVIWPEYVLRLTGLLGYDLILLDLRLIPKNDAKSDYPSGINVLKFIRSINPCIPILIFTASQNFNIKNTIIEINTKDSYWIKNVNQADDLRQKVMNMLVDLKVHEVYWKTRLVLNKDSIKKYAVSASDLSVRKENLNRKEIDEVKKAFDQFVNFYLKGSDNLENFWKNTLNLNEVRFKADKNGRMDRPQLIEILNLNEIEHQFNIIRKNIAHIDTSRNNKLDELEDIDLFKKYINYSIDWFLSDMHNKG